jgi:hypothetical protein
MGGGCTAKETFVVCNGRLDITPGPGKTTLDSAYVEVCWAAGEGPEVIPFDCCGSFFLLGNCDCSCVTTLLYEGAGCTSAASIEMRGDAVIDSSGTGALVLTAANITQDGTCAKKLTLTGTSTANNEITGAIRNPSGNLAPSVEKTGAGQWILSGTVSPPNDVTYTVSEGTLRVNDARAIPSEEITVGGTVGDAFLVFGVGLVSGVSVKVPAGTPKAIIGGANDAIHTGEILMSRATTLAAATGGTAAFRGAWSGSATGSPADQDVTIGDTAYQGTVILGGFFNTFLTSGTVTVAYGTCEVGQFSLLQADGGVTINDGATLVVRQLADNPGDLATSATFTDDTLTVAFSGDPTTGDEYILLLGPTNNTIATVTLTGTTKTGTYDSATSTLTID